MEIRPIAYFKSPFPEKFGIPRQAGLAEGLKGKIVFEPDYRSADAVRGLEGFDYIWLIWGFSAASRSVSGGVSMGEDHATLGTVRGGTGAEQSGASGGAERSEASEPSRTPPETTFRATVRPPRLGGNERVGVFASRSPFRPNGLGLSSVKVSSISLESRDSSGKDNGPVIEVLGADLMDGTPIYDIKPYVEYADSHPGVRSGFVDSKVWTRLEVVLPPEADGCGLDLAVLREVLSLDPRPRYHDDPSKVYGMTFAGRNVRFKVEDSVLTVLGID